MKNIEVVSAGNPDYKNTRVYFTWFLVNWCNYSCSYCCADGAMVESYDKDTSNAKYKLTIVRLKQVKTDFEIYMFGGEPTLHPHFNEILKELSEIPHCKAIEIDTNLSRSLSFFENLYKSDKVSISASYHPEYFSQAYVDKCIALKDNSFDAHINLTDNPDDWPEVLSLVETLKANGVKYGFNLLYSAKGREINYDEKFYETWKPHFDGVDDGEYLLNFSDGSSESLPAIDIYGRGLDNFNGYNCVALMYNIDIDGNISNICTGEKLPLIVNPEDTHKFSKCPLTSCNCEVMFNFYKEIR
jgi:hypothetical protein